MKHTFKVTLVLVLVFFISQIVGLAITSKYIDVKEEVVFDEELNKTVVVKDLEYSELPYIERPEVKEQTSFLYILAAILIGTGLVLLIIKFQTVNLWRIWFFLAVSICLTIAFGAFIQKLIAVAAAVIFAAWKTFKPNPTVHNLTEVFIYGGLAAIFVPIMNLFSVTMLLILISVYDIYAVWKSKHMVKLAKFVSDSKLFAGLAIPYKRPKAKKIVKVAVPEKGVLKRKGVRVAILGGGDIGFPLFFSGVVMKGLMLEGYLAGFLKTLVITVFASAALFLLFVKGKKDRFYPAMPFLAAGCFLGYGVVLLLGLFF